MPLESASELIRRGISIPHPESVYIAPEVDIGRLAPGTTIWPGCRIMGGLTSIGPGCSLGAEAPVTLRDCRLGAEVALQGGYFEEATLLDRARMGSAAHVRPGTLIEEEAGGAHAVGLKQTILMPFVTLGSLVNFCDCLMAGGTSRKNHSEVGSSYVHFNFTPHQDKATASLIGDVPRGVMLDQPPIFLGGQGGLVGPARLAYGVIIPAGIIQRGDILQPGMTAAPPAAGGTHPDYQPGRYRKINRIIVNNLHYIGNLAALRGWYVHVRAPCMRQDAFRQACWQGALDCLDAGWRERLKQLDGLAAKMPRSLELNGFKPEAAATAGRPEIRDQYRLHREWPAMRAALSEINAGPWSEQSRQVLAAALDRAGDRPYLETLRAMAPAALAAARAEMQSVIDACIGLWRH